MRIEIGQVIFEVQLQPFRPEENTEYLLVDTGCVLGLLKRLNTILYIIKEKELKLAILERTICEVSEHLCKSRESLLSNGFSTFHIDSAAQNFRKLLQDGRVKKIANPIFSDKHLSKYYRFVEDAVLAYALYEGNFKAIATMDGPLSKRLEKKKCFPCQALFRK